MVKTDWSFQWTRAGKLLASLDMDAIIADPKLARHLKHYLQKLVDWTRAYTETGRDTYNEHFPYEWAEALATALGRYAAAAGVSAMWQPLTEFQSRNHGEQMVCDYLEAVTRELIDSRRAPDDRFWTAWRGAADWLLGQHGPEQWLSDDHFEEWATEAGLMGAYMTPLPPDWPHLDAVLPVINRWAEMACVCAPTGHRLVKFAERFDTRQRVSWLLPWARLMVKHRTGNREFWNYGDMGDKLAILLEPLATADAKTRTEVRRLVAVIADAGSLAAREVLTRLAGQRGVD